jgi:hypothetical protein
MQSAEAVHMGLVWKKNVATPKILFHARFPEYVPNDMADPAIIDLAIARGAFTTPGLQFNSSLRDVLHGFDPFLGLGTNRSADDSFQRLTYGGYLMRQALSQSVPTRIRANRTMERQLLFDMSHPDAFKNSGKFRTSLLDEADFALNRAAFAENGHSKGMFYQKYARWYPSAIPLPNDTVLQGQSGRRGGLRPQDRSKHRAGERTNGLPALPAARGRPDGPGKGRLEGVHVRRRDQLWR